MAGHRCCAIDFVLPIGSCVLIPVSDVGIRKDSRRCNNYVSRPVLCCTEVIDCMHKLARTHQVKLLAQLLITLIEAVVYNWFTFLSLFGGDEDDTIGAL